MSCPDPSELAHYLEDDADLELRSAIRMHLSVCPRCREQVGRMRRSRSPGSAEEKTEIIRPGGSPADRTEILRPQEAAGESPGGSEVPGPDRPPEGGDRPPDAPRIEEGTHGSPPERSPEPETTQPRNLPERIGRYRILSELGHGSLGVVYEAEDAELRRRIALRTLPSRLASSPALMARLREESQLQALLRHPNVADVHSLEREGNLHFLTQELVPGRSLAARLGSGPLGLEETLRLGRQIAAALEAAHARGLIHRDLTPGNVLVAGDGTAKLVNFGLAETVELDPDRDPAAGPLLGTPGYMSPEQLREEPVDARADVWAFGCVLFECLTGSPAFPGRTARERAASTVSGEPDWDSLPEETPEAVKRLLRDCLARDAGTRPDAASRIRKKLEDAIAGPGVGATAPGSDDLLPLPSSSLHGREREIEEVALLLEESRLATLTGIAGCGRSRLALETARRVRDRFPEGVVWIDLAPLDEGSALPAILAGALGVREGRGRSFPDALSGYLRRKAVLLILDDGERVLDASTGFLTALLEGAEELRILCTADRELGAPREATYPVPSLGLPPPSEYPTLEEIRESDAVALFADRAAAANPDFRLDKDSADPVTRICRLLCGNPLALEIAAARIKVLPAAEIARRLEERFRKLTGGEATSLPREQVLPAFLDWSFHQLPPAERTLLRRLAVFAGGWTLEAMEEICAGDGFEDWAGLDLLSKLLQKSLVVRDGGSEPARYRLPVPVRELAEKELIESKEGEGLERRHRTFYLRTVERIEEMLRGPGQNAARAAFQRDRHDLRRALGMGGESRDDGQAALRLAGAMGPFWALLGSWSEAHEVCQDLLIRLTTQGRTSALGKVMSWAGVTAQSRGEHGRARDYHRESLSIHESLGDPVGQANAYHHLGEIAASQDDLRRAREFHQRGLELRRRAEFRWGEAWSLTRLGIVALRDGRPQDAGEPLHEAVGIWRETGDRRNLGAALLGEGVVRLETGDPDRARALLEESLEMARSSGAGEEIARSLHQLAIALWRLGEHERAEAREREALTLRRDHGDRAGIAASLVVLAGLPRDPGNAARLLGAAEALIEEIGATLFPHEVRVGEEIAAGLEKNLGQGGYEAARREGKGMDPVAAVDLALAPEEPVPPHPENG